MADLIYLTQFDSIHLAEMMGTGISGSPISKQKGRRLTQTSNSSNMHNVHGVHANTLIFSSTLSNTLTISNTIFWVKHPFYLKHLLYTKHQLTFTKAPNNLFIILLPDSKVDQAFLRTIDMEVRWSTQWRPRRGTDVINMVDEVREYLPEKKYLEEVVR